MGLAPHLAGPHDPLPGTPVRGPGWFRRTTTIDTRRPDGLQGPSHIDARGRDAIRAGDVFSTVRDQALQAIAEPSSELVAVSATPALTGLDRLVGASLRSGFRRVLREQLGETLTGSLAGLLLDDLTGANLVGGYAGQIGDGERMEAAMRAAGNLMLAQAGVCSGWAEDGSIMVTLRREGVVPTPVGPPAPALVPDEDQTAWHTMAPLGPHDMRRARRIDVGPVGADGLRPFETHFRDSHYSADRGETVLHEYTVHGTFDPVARILVDVMAEARVLPWLECPEALASAGRLAGTPLGDLRNRVRQDLHGVGTCTHLNDTLRSLADLGELGLST